MQGLGNDYIFLDLFRNNFYDIDFSKLARDISNRHFGVGGDGLVLIMPSTQFDVKMRMFNADGTEAEMCGNAVRCIARYVYQHNIIKRNILKIDTLAGKITTEILFDKDDILIAVDMGKPIFSAKKIPVKIDRDTVINYPLRLTPYALHNEYYINCVSIGNPHCVIFVDKITDKMVLKDGEKLEKADIFPERINVEFARIVNRSEIEMRVWERGTGETLACGTGATAAVAAAFMNNLVDRKVTAHLLGGDLEIEIMDNEHLRMIGPAKEVFYGTYFW